MIIKPISQNDREPALSLVLNVFLQYEAPDYTAEGVETFKQTVLYNKDFISSLTMYGAYENDELLGVIATRNNGNHIALFFVDGQHHRKGIGRLLFQTALTEAASGEITVHSSPYAREFYGHLGFEAMSPEQTTDGIRYTPMLYKKDTSHIEALISMLEEKDNSKAYKALQELEKISDEKGILYAYTDKFAGMTGSDKYVIRVRGFRLFCKQAKWDKDFILDENIDAVLSVLNDDKPTAVRQALAALSDVVLYKPDLRETVKQAVSKINCLRYKDTMHSLIAGDIQKVLDLIRQTDL